MYDLVENIRWCVTRCLRMRLCCIGRRADRRAAEVCFTCTDASCIALLCACSVRFSKIERGLRRLDGASAAYIRLNNVSAMEVRRFLHTALCA